MVDDSGKEVPRDNKTTGEILVRTPWCTAGYLKDDAESESLWAGEWLHTGDAGTMDEYGYIQIVDRFKDVIKSGGEWIVSLEVERLISLHAGVREASVIGIPDEVWGERPLALIVPGLEAEVSEEGLREHLGTFVTAGAITPAAIPDHFIFVEEIAKTSVGKHDKKLLRKRYQEHKI